MINLNSIAVGLYLAFTLSKRFGKEEGEVSSDQYYEVVLLLIMISSIVTSFGGKYLSNKIVSLTRFFMPLFIVHGDQPENPR